MSDAIDRKPATEAKKAAREWLEKFVEQDQYIVADEIIALAGLLDSYAAEQVVEARLEEAKWWHEWGAEPRNCPNDCRGCRKLAALEAARKETK